MPLYVLFVFNVGQYSGLRRSNTGPKYKEWNKLGQNMNLIVEQRSLHIPIPMISEHSIQVNYPLRVEFVSLF